MFNVKDFTFIIPPLWEKDWNGAISKAKGADRDLLICQAQALSMLKDINNFKVTPERIAWLSMWTKAFAALEGAKAALGINSQYIFKIIQRVSFEGCLHAELIFEPLSNMYRMKQSNKKVIISKWFESGTYNQIIIRLQAYAAWCFWNDKLFYEELLDSRTLHGIWDPEPAKQILNDPDMLSVHKKIYGPLDIETNKAELKESRLKMEEFYREKLKRTEVWLEYPSLVQWKKKIEELRKKPDGPITFFTLFDESVKSVPKRLCSVDLRFAYASYMEGSMLIHGSTIDQLMQIDEKKIFPSFIGSEETSESSAAQISSTCNKIFVLLYIFRNSVWNLQDNEE
ncbi:MAG: hypothetical protein H8D87_10350 [Deltaproteobacteria bacterium]|uniref:hypothetical protein n=1 Tax=Desulfobacula sp. TaxID=2593537 RepID=UPI0019A2558C|nr:hypothetical protein [Candidatus Desulfobacula maris]MBL6995096.1 hypothetical protein [Desulfobacula sp.]